MHLPLRCTLHARIRRHQTHSTTVTLENLNEPDAPLDALRVRPNTTYLAWSHHTRSGVWLRSVGAQAVWE